MTHILSLYDTHIVPIQAGKKRENVYHNRPEDNPSEVTNTQVFKAASAGTAEELRDAIRSKKPPRETLNVALFRSVVDLNFDKVLVLLLQGASVHCVDAGQTPLHRCLSWADLSDPSEIEPMLRLLVAAGANLEARDEDGKRPAEYCHASTLASLQDALTERRPFMAVAAALVSDPIFLDDSMP